MRQSATAGGLGIAASALLGRLSREGPSGLTGLARAERVSQPNVTQLVTVTRMERAGLVRRTADRSDGRGVPVAVTEAGAEVFAQRRAERARALGELMAELSESERCATEVALSALARVIRGRRQERG